MKADRVLFVSNLFPSSVEPGRGSFNLDQLLALREAGLAATVVAPRPWFPGLQTRSTRQAASPPALETIEGFRVAHPRAFYLPLWRGSLNGRLYGWSVLRACRAAAQAFDPDFLWVSFAFPDAVGARWVARGLGLPLVITVHGSDVHVSLRMPRRRGAMVETFRSAAAVFCKSAALGTTLVGAGVDPAQVHVVYNGVDRGTFHSRPRQAACRELSVDPERRRVLFVGNLVAVKGVPDLLEAVRLAPTFAGAPLELVLVGDGPLEASLRDQARRLGIGPQVRFAGREPRDRVALWMAASDVLVLPSRDEGVPNVVLETLACGRPVVAAAVGGVPEVHPGEPAGAIVPPRDPGSLSLALQGVLARSWDPSSLAQLTSRFDWPPNARKLLGIIRAAQGAAT